MNLPEFLASLDPSAYPAIKSMVNRILGQTTYPDLRDIVLTGHVQGIDDKGIVRLSLPDDNEFTLVALYEPDLYQLSEKRGTTYKKLSNLPFWTWKQYSAKRNVLLNKLADTEEDNHKWLTDVIQANRQRVLIARPLTNKEAEHEVKEVFNRLQNRHPTKSPAKDRFESIIFHTNESTNWSKVRRQILNLCRENIDCWESEHQENVKSIIEEHLV